MHIWKTIKALRDCTPVPLDMALKALRPDNPREFILRLYNKGWLLGEFYPSQLLLDMVNHTLEARKAGVIKDAVPLHPPEKQLCPLESAPNLSDSSSWERIYILREDLLAIRVLSRYEQWRKRRTNRKRATIVSALPATTPPPAADQQTALHRGEKVYRGQKEITEAFNKHSGKKAIGWPAIRLKREQCLNIVYEPHGLKEVPTLDHYDLLDFFDLLPR